MSSSAVDRKALTNFGDLETRRRVADRPAPLSAALADEAATRMA